MATHHPATPPLPHLRRGSQVSAHSLPRLSGAGAAVALLVVVWLAAAVSRHPGPFAADASVMNGFVQVRTSALTVVARIIAVATDPAVTAAMVILIALWWWLRRKDRSSAVFLMAAAVLTAVLLEAAKLIVDRPRPPTSWQLMPETNNSFPSGHVTGVVAVFGVLAFLSVGRGARRSLVTTIWAALVALVVLDRLYLGVHWASDVLGALLLGTAILLSAVVVARRYFPHLRQRESLSRNGFTQ